MKAPERLVVRGVNWLGDAVMSMPALARLREALPETHIALLTADKLADLWHGHPSVDEVIPFNKQQGVGHVSRALRSGRFDSALILPNSFRSAFEPWLAGIKMRVGHAAPGRSFLLSNALAGRAGHIEMYKKSASEVKRLVADSPLAPRERFPKSAHHLHQYLSLAAFFGATEAPCAPSLPIPAEEVDALATRLGIEAKPLRIGLNPGAEYGPAKRWPIEYFMSAAAKLQARLAPQFLIFGGPGDTAAGGRIEAALRSSGGAVVNLCGKTTLRELAAGLSMCRAVLTNDTGPMHLAAAVGSRVVVPFGSTSPELTGPGLPGDPRHKLLLGAAPCAPCFLRVCPIDFRCMRSISDAEILAAVAEVVNSA